jgi:hypothetical protein
MADAAATASAPTGSRRHVVALTSAAFYGVDDPCVAGIDCRRSLDSAIARARARGVRVVALGTSDQLADLAVRTGGVFLDADSPHQLEGAARALPSLLSGTAPRQRLIFDLTGGRDTFVAGGTVYAILRIEIAPAQWEHVAVAIPIPAT